MDTIYQRKGYKDRNDYLMAVAEDYGLDPVDVYTVACLLGPEEDFDGLISMIQELPERD
jgi:hypothetical protein